MNRHERRTAVTGMAEPTPSVLVRRFGMVESSGLRVLR